MPPNLSEPALAWQFTRHFRFSQFFYNFPLPLIGSVGLGCSHEHQMRLLPGLGAPVRRLSRTRFEDWPLGSVRHNFMAGWRRQFSASGEYEYFSWELVPGASGCHNKRRNISVTVPANAGSRFYRLNS